VPITLPPISRRRFLSGSLAAGAGLLATGRVWAEQAPVDANRFALLSDTHVSGDREETVQGTNMYKNMLQVGRELNALDRRPAAALITGDCARMIGKAEDYVALVETLDPIRGGGVPVHLALGNHDNREEFWKAIPPGDAPSVVENKHITVLEAPLANLILLDSLDKPNVTPGVLGKEQLAWLGEKLDALGDGKPTLILAHHHLDDAPKTNGMTETKKLMEIVMPRKQVKAYFYGHTHTWRVSKRGTLQLVNLPPTAYVFGKNKPNGWVDMQLTKTGAKLQVHAIDKKHPANEQQVELTWRA